ncbi:MAG TPA: cupin domain-containing protein [Gammaproteobacteria bacterium]|nr:cupin domain-containing protein [Gammaproteobacteria bacterium]
MYKAFAVVVTGLSLSLGIVACGQEEELEQAGKRIEKAAENASDWARKATENAGDKIEQWTDQATTGEKHLILAPTELQWSDVASMAPGAKIAVIEGDMSEQEPFTARLRFPAGYRIDPHTHPAYERVTVLSGRLHFAHGEKFDRSKTTAMPVGSFAVMPPGAPMFGYTEEETVIQIHGEGPWGIEYVNPKDDPRR